MDMKKMMEQAQQMQFKLQELQERFKEMFVEGQAGGGLVKIEMSCAGVVKSINIDPSLFDLNENFVVCRNDSPSLISSSTHYHTHTDPGKRGERVKTQEEKSVIQFK